MGNHTVHHCHSDLSGCSNGSATSLDGEIDDCNSYIAGHFGQSAVWTAASPFGDTGYDTPDMTRFFLNRGVGSGTIAANDSTDPFNLPCHAATDGETVAASTAAIDGAHTAGRWLIFLIHTIAPTAAIWYAPIDVSVVSDSVAHAKSLADVWIDTVVSVGAYWRAQKMVSAMTPAAAGAEPDLDLDPARALSARQVPAHHRRRRHAVPERRPAVLGRARLLRDRAGRRIADALHPIDAPHSTNRRRRGARRRSMGLRQRSRTTAPRRRHARQRQPSD